MTYRIGIDPGSAGAIVLLDSHNRIIEWDAMPVLKIGSATRVNGPALAAILTEFDSAHAYVYAQRTNLGTVRRDENAMWSLAPHDLSMLLHLLDGEMPESVSARGGSYLQPGIEDVVFVNMRFPSGVLAQIHLSWLDPRKERRLTVVGSQKMVELDDAHPVEKLRIYDKGVDRPPPFTEYAQYLQLRNGDIVIPRIPMAEPLELEARHFIECITDDKPPRADGQSALKIVRLLEAAQRSLARDGTPFLI